VDIGCSNCASALWNRERFGIHGLRQVHLRSHRHTLRVVRFGDMAVNLRSVSGCGTIVPLRTAYGFRWG